MEKTLFSRGLRCGSCLNYTARMSLIETKQLSQHANWLQVMASGFELGTVEVSSSPQERFAEFLQSKGKRITQQRRIMVDHVFERHDHFDAEELIINLATQPEGSKVSRPTVYRTLNELVDAGLLRRMNLGGRAVYEHDYGLSSARSSALYGLRSADRIPEQRSARTSQGGGWRAFLPRNRSSLDHLPAFAPIVAANATDDKARWT